LEHQLIIVGIGPGSPDYILPSALKAIKEASLLVGGSRALKDYAKSHQQTRKVDSDISGLLEYVHNQLTERDVVVIVSGDPGYYSLLETMRREFPADCIRVIPGLSSFQCAFARIGLPWQAARLISAHGRQPEMSELRFEAGRALSFLTDGKNHPAIIASWLQEQGWPLQARVWLCKNLSYENEVILETTVEAALLVSGFDSCVMVVME
jgi:cobalt-precorrin-7 (C5)-methyltransferase